MLDLIRYTQDGAVGFINPRYVEEVSIRETSIAVRLTSGSARTLLFATAADASTALVQINTLVSRSIPT